MQLRIRAQRLELAPATRLAIERRVRLALGRNAARIELTQVTLSPVLGAGPGTLCRVRIRMHQGESMAIEDQAPDPLEAVAAAAWRLQRRLERPRSDRPAGPSHARRRGLP